MNNQSGYNKRSLKERENMAITVYKYLLDNNRIAYDILNIKMKVLTDFINKYGLNINKAMKFSVDIWVSLQNIFKLNIFGFIHFNFIAFIFCIRFIFRMKNYYKILPKFIVYIFPSTFIKLVRKVIYI